MPVIPRVEGPSVQQRVIDQPKARNVDVSSGLKSLGKAIEGVGTTFSLIEQDKAKTEAENAVIDFTNAKNDVLFNPDTGYYNTMGRNAVDGMEPTGKTLDDLLKQKRETLSPQAQALFDQKVNDIVLRDKQGMMRHSSQGYKTWKTGTLKNRELNAIQQAAIYYNDPKQLNAAMTDAQDAIIERNQFTGTPELITTEQKILVSSMAKSAINGALDRKNVDAARELLDTPGFGDKLTGADRTAAIKAVEDAETERKINTYTIQISESGLPLKDQYSQVSEIEDLDSDEKIDLRRQLDLIDGQNRRAEKDYVTDTVDSVSDSIMSGQLRYGELDKSTLEALGRDGRRLLQMTQKERDTGVYVTTDWGIYQEIMSNPDDIVKNGLPLSKMEKLNKTERDDVISLYKATTKNGGQVKGQSYTSAVTRARQVSDVLKTFVPATPSKYTEYDKERVNWFNAELNSSVQAKEEQLKRKLTPDEFTAELNNFKRKTVIEKPHWFFDRVDRVELGLTDISEDDWNDITSKLDAAGVPVTPDVVREFYAEGVRRGDY